MTTIEHLLSQVDTQTAMALSQEVDTLIRNRGPSTPDMALALSIVVSHLAKAQQQPLDFVEAVAEMMRRGVNAELN